MSKYIAEPNSNSLIALTTQDVLHSVNDFGCINLLKLAALGDYSPLIYTLNNQLSQRQTLQHLQKNAYRR